MYREIKLHGPLSIITAHAIITETYLCVFPSGSKLGIALEGGITSPAIPGDPGIFVRRVNPGSLADGKLKNGDRILTVSPSVYIPCLKG